MTHVSFFVLLGGAKVFASWANCRMLYLVSNVSTQNYLQAFIANGKSSFTRLDLSVLTTEAKLSQRIWNTCCPGEDNLRNINAQSEKLAIKIPPVKTSLHSQITMNFTPLYDFDLRLIFDLV